MASSRISFTLSLMRPLVALVEVHAKLPCSYIFGTSVLLCWRSMELSLILFMIITAGGHYNLFQSNSSCDFKYLSFWRWFNSKNSLFCPKRDILNIFVFYWCRHLIRCSSNFRLASSSFPDSMRPFPFPNIENSKKQSRLSPFWFLKTLEKSNFFHCGLFLIFLQFTWCVTGTT